MNVAVIPAPQANSSRVASSASTSLSTSSRVL